MVTGDHANCNEQHMHKNIYIILMVTVH